MTKTYNIFKIIRDRLFKKGRSDDSADTFERSVDNKKNKETIYQQNIVDSSKRDPYFIQIGFDFGTSYSKCICRDVMTNKAWVHMPEGFDNQELPFLIPSTLLFGKESIGLSSDSSKEYQKNGFYHIKIALEKVALEKLNDPVLAPYISSLDDTSSKALNKYISNYAIYFLSKTFRRIKTDIENRYPNFGQNKKDYIAVNLAVPVADAERTIVNETFHKVLCIAWSMATENNIENELSHEELSKLVEIHNKECSKNIVEACYIYPEVSANVQGFIRSSVSKPGIYLFSDTGAGTVDQSVFIFNRKEENELLTYLHGSVLPFGSSKIEKKAAAISGDRSWENLEKWRRIKELGGDEVELLKAKKSVHVDLIKGTKVTLQRASKKLYVKEQLHDIRVIFGGGGYCENPYKTAVMKGFNNQLFPTGYHPDIIGLPIPKDLEVDNNKIRWINRLSVAYGLSFVKTDLADNIYPKDLKNPKPEEIQRAKVRLIEDAPTKDDC